MWDANPDLIEEPDQSSAAALRTPLVLIHDGGGTTFSYHCMHPALGRPIWGIANPRFHTGEPWAGGLPEMARHYVTLLRNAIGRGPIILGGWSLGGLISLEMSRLLAGDRWLRVVGVVMIDSVCPLVLRTAPPAQLADTNGNDDTKPKTASPPAQIAVATEHAFSSTTKDDTKAKVKRCFAESSAMVHTWTLPRWSDSDETSSRRPGASGGVAAARSPLLLPPPAILLRAQEAVPLEEGQDVARVDLARDDRRLGWDLYRPGLFREIVDIPGHHYNIFAEANVDEVRSALIDACEALEQLP